MYFRKSSLNSQEQEYLRTEGPSLNSLCATTAIPESFRLPLDANTYGGGLSLRNAPNTNVRLVFYILLNLSFRNTDREQASRILVGLKSSLFSAEIPIQYLAEVLHYSHLTVLSRENLLKKVLAEFLQAFTHSKVENIWGLLHNYPIADLAFIIVVRSLMFNEQQDIGLLDFNKHIPTGALLNSIGSLVGLKHKQNKEHEWMIEGKWLLTEQEEITSVRDLCSSDSQGGETTTSAGSESHYLTEEFSPTKRKIGIEDARNAVSEESQQTESDVESEVVFKHQFLRNEEQELQDIPDAEPQQQLVSDYFKKSQPHETVSYSHQQQPVHHAASPVSPIPLNYDIKNGYFMNAAARNNNLFTSKTKVMRQEEQSNDSKGRRVSLSKERLSAKKKPGIPSMRDLAARQAIYIPDDLTKESSGSSNFYNGMAQPPLPFMYGNLPGLPPKSHSQQKRVMKMTATLEEQEKMTGVARRQQSPYDRSRLIAQTRRLHNKL